MNAHPPSYGEYPYLPPHLSRRRDFGKDGDSGPTHGAGLSLRTRESEPVYQTHPVCVDPLCLTYGFRPCIWRIAEVWRHSARVVACFIGDGGGNESRMRGVNICGTNARCYNHCGVASEDNRNVSPVVQPNYSCFRYSIRRGDGGGCRTSY